MKLKLFQKQDLARAALHDGLVLSWDTGLGKTWALYLWPLLKVGFERLTPQTADEPKLKPKGPVLIIAPGDLHAQIMEEGWTRFGIRTVLLDSQDKFYELTRRKHSVLPNLTTDGRPILPPDFYITSYTQLATNGVTPPPDAYDWPDPRGLLQWLCLKIGEHVPTVNEGEWNDGKINSWQNRPEFFDTVSHFFAWRGMKWSNEYRRLCCHPEDTLDKIVEAYEREMEAANSMRDPRAAGAIRAKLTEAYEILKNLHCGVRDPKIEHLAREQQDWVIREFCADTIEHYQHGIGTTKSYPMGDPPEDFNPEKPETDTRPKWRIKCVWQPTLSDLSFNAFDCVSIDEGVKMKGEDTLVGLGVRQMEPKYRQVLTATPVKNRLPDIFRLAWWAAGGKQEAHARWPYRDDTSERTKFAQTFMVSEHNITKEQKAASEAAANGTRYVAGGGRFKKLTAEVCNVHRLWKLLGPIVLRRRKDDCGEDIVPKVRKVVRCEMGRQQELVYRYHLKAAYIDKNGRPAIGAQLQALRAAAADPSSDHLQDMGEISEACTCVNGERPKCPKCHGTGSIELPHRSGQPYIPKVASTLKLIQEILDRKEQCVVFSAFNDPLDNLSTLLSEASVRHVTLDGRVSQKKRGRMAAVFKRGRMSTDTEAAVPVMLAGVECMAEGHSFHLANNVILVAYSWAYDKFIQAINRVHRMTSEKPVNVYVVLCTGTIDRKLESLIQDKGDAAELVLDGRLIGERSEEVNLAELLRIAQREFNQETKTLDEALLQAQWTELRDQLAAAMRAWDPPAIRVATARQDANSPFQPKPKTKTMRPNTPLNIPKPEAPAHAVQTPALPASRVSAGLPKSTPTPAADWRERMKARVARLAQAQKADVWASL